MNALKLVGLEDDFACYTPAAANPVFSEIEIIYRELFRENAYLRRLGPVRPNGYVIDAGANVGLFTLFIKRSLPEAEVLAIEPIPDNVHALRANIQMHGVTGVTVCPQGLSDMDDVRDFHFFPSMPGNSTTQLTEKMRDKETMTTYAPRHMAEEVFQYKTVRVPVARLSVLMSEVGVPDEIDLLKMDIEGDEVRALQGIDGSDWPRIRQIVMEVHKARVQLPEVLDILKAQGFKPEVETPADIPDGLDNKIVSARRA